MGRLLTMSSQQSPWVSAPLGERLPRRSFRGWPSGTKDQSSSHSPTHLPSLNALLRKRLSTQTVVLCLLRAHHSSQSCTTARCIMVGKETTCMSFPALVLERSCPSLCR